MVIKGFISSVLIFLLNSITGVMAAQAAAPDASGICDANSPDRDTQPLVRIPFDNVAYFETPFEITFCYDVNKEGEVINPRIVSSADPSASKVFESHVLHRVTRWRYAKSVLRDSGLKNVWAKASFAPPEEYPPINLQDEAALAKEWQITEVDAECICRRTNNSGYQLHLTEKWVKKNAKDGAEKLFEELKGKAVSAKQECRDTSLCNSTGRAERQTTPINETVFGCVQSYGEQYTFSLIGDANLSEPRVSLFITPLSRCASL